jgi:hypothetical protein
MFCGSLFVLFLLLSSNSSYSRRMFQTTNHVYTTVQVSGHVFVLYGRSDRSCICVYRVPPFSLPTIFLLDFGTICFCFSSFYQLLCSSYIYGKMIYIYHKMFRSVLYRWFKKKKKISH